jgi:hypothetical protein
MRGEAIFRIRRGLDGLKLVFPLRVRQKPAAIAPVFRHITAATVIAFDIGVVKINQNVRCGRDAVRRENRARDQHFFALVTVGRKHGARRDRRGRVRCAHAFRAGGRGVPLDAAQNIAARFLRERVASAI